MAVPTAHRAHLRFFALAFLLTVVLAALGGSAFQRTIARFQPLGFVATQQDGAWHIDAITHPRVGLQPGDVLMQADGAAVTSVAELRQRLHERATVPALTLRGDELTVVSYQRPPIELDGTYLLLVVISVLYVAIGLVTLGKTRVGALRAAAGAAAATRLFYLWCLASAALYLLAPPPLPVDSLDVAIFFGDQAARTLLPFLTLHLFAVFPTAPSARVRRLLPLLYVLPAALLALHADLALTGGRLIAGAPSASLLDRLARAELVLLALAGLGAAAMLGLRLARLKHPETRQQAQWITAGLVAGYLPFLLLYAAPRLLDAAGGPDWLTLLAVAPLALVPVAFAWAILKHRLWDLEYLLRTGASYALTGLVGVFGFVLVELGLRRGLSGVDGSVRDLLTFGAGLVVAGVLVPTRGAIAAGLGRFSGAGARRALREVGRDLLHERNLDTLCARLLDALRTHLDLERVA
ncbi:MAG: hypothetical protein AAF772_21770, partial [Acidobacteriota bacterium]